MKVCPACQAPFSDNSLKFCLECGTPLSSAIQDAQKTGGSGALIAAIASVFLLLVLVVGGFGIYFFSQPTNEKADLNKFDKNANQTGQTGKNTPRNENRAPTVEQLGANKKNEAAISVNSNNSANNSASRVLTSSSSVRKSEKGNFYFPNFAFDNNAATAWCEGANGAGEGEWLQFDFGNEITLKQIKIMPGYFKNNEVWSKNNRVAAVTLEYSNGQTADGFRFADKMETQIINLDSVRTSRVKIIINEYFRGSSEADDTLISEVSFVTEQ